MGFFSVFRNTVFAYKEPKLGEFELRIHSLIYSLFLQLFIDHLQCSRHRQVRSSEQNKMFSWSLHADGYPVGQAAHHK